MVTRSTRGWWSQRARRACSTRAVVDFPTATLTGDTDDERHLTVGMLLTEERRGGREQPLARRHLQVDQTCEGEIDLGDFFEIDLLAETTQAVQLVLGQHQRRRLTQCAATACGRTRRRDSIRSCAPSAQLTGIVVNPGPGGETAMRASQARVRTIRVHSRIVLGATSGTFAGWHSGRAARLGRHGSRFTCSPISAARTGFRPSRRRVRRRVSPVIPRCVSRSRTRPKPDPRDLARTARELRASWPEVVRMPSAPSSSTFISAPWNAPGASSRARTSASSTRCEAYFDVRIEKGNEDAYQRRAPVDG